MSNNTQKTIVLASVLKPVSDPRMYKKMALTLLARGDCRVYLFGQAGELPALPPRLRVWQRPAFGRLSWRRWITNLVYCKFLLQVKPDLIIYQTPELQAVTCAYKILFGAKICYDVQENYFRNVARSGVYPRGLGWGLGTLLRLSEYLTRPLHDHYFLAERGYAQEFGFTRHKSTILENKYKPSVDFKNKPAVRTNPRFRLLYSGTIAAHYGIFEAVALAKALHAHDARFELRVIGYAAQASVRTQLRAAVSDAPYIRLEGLDKPVPHTAIEAAMAEAGCGLVPYRPNPSTENCLPTKLFEYAAHRLPMLIPGNPLWLAFCQKWNAGFSIDFTRPNIGKIAKVLFSSTFYQVPGPDLDRAVRWEADEHPRLLQKSYDLLP